MAIIPSEKKNKRLDQVGKRVLKGVRKRKVKISKVIIKKLNIMYGMTVSLLASKWSVVGLFSHYGSYIAINHLF